MKRTFVKKRRKWIKNHRAIFYTGFVSFIIIVTAIIILIINFVCNRILEKDNNTSVNPIPRPELDVELLTINEYSRPAFAMDNINGIVIHYTANPGSSAIQNRNYFEGLKDSHTTKASGHFIIGLDGEIVQCIPCSEISYASNGRNSDTISIECCHADESGEFNGSTYDSLVHLTAWLCLEFDVNPKNIIRHYDVTGKDCPKYYVENEDKWDAFIKDVRRYIKKYD